MGMRLERIRVLRNGPLAEDVDFRPRDLNLIYGRNETGKTYLLESMLRFLFKTGGRSYWGGDDGVRELPVRGRIELSGLHEATTSFTKTKEKIEDHLDGGGDMPAEPSRLLVVRAGKTGLSGVPGGAGRDVLVSILGGKEVLEDVDKRVGSLAHGLEVSGGAVSGNRKILRAREEAAERLRGVEELHGMVEGSDDALRLRSIGQRKEALQERIRMMDLARRHRSWKLREALDDVERELAGLPEEGELSRIADLFESTESKRGELSAAEEELRARRERISRLQWVRHAAQTYRSLLEEDGSAESPDVWFNWAIGLLVAASVAGSLAELPALAVGAGALAVVLLVAAARARSRGETAEQTRERERTEQRYRELFGEEMAGLASLRRRAAELDKLEGRLQAMEEGLGRLAGEVEGMEEELESLCRRCLGRPLADADPVADSSAVRNSRRELEERAREIGLMLARLDVDAKDDLEEDPGGEWSRSKYEELRKQLADLERQSAEAEGNLNRLRTRLAAETGELEAQGYSGLIEALRRKRNRAEEEYRESTALLLAKACVASAIDRLKKREDELLAESLASSTVVEYLRDLTGRYGGMRLKGEELLLQTVEGDEFSLRELSTGAREQVLLALRSAMAELTFREPAFMLLDDAFQHSDWERRDRLVEHCLNLVEKGWQVFYFCMDDDIRRRLVQAGKGLGDRFGKVKLESARSAP